MMLPRMVLPGAALLLCACEGSLGISLSATPPEDVSAAVLSITAVELQREDGSSERIDVAKDINTLALARGGVTSLVSDAEVGAGNYTSLRLVLAAQSQVLDSYLEDSAGGQTSLVLTAGSTATTSSGFRVRDEEDTQLTVHVDLRSSLLFGSNAAGDRQFSPRLRVIETGEAGTISGNVDVQLLEEAGCDTSDQTGQVVYVFTGNVTPDDLDGITPEPLTTALLRSSQSSADYVAAFLPASTYTLAVTCNADLDDPSLNDDIGFVSSATVNLSAGTTETLNFSP